MLGRKALERLDEDASWAFRAETEEASDSHSETDPTTEDRFLSEEASIAAMDPPSLLAADGTACVGVRRSDVQGQRIVIESGVDQATAERSMQKLEQKQEVPPKRREQEINR